MEEAAGDLRELDERPVPRGDPVEFIEQVFDVMRRSHWHVFQVLTKRHERLSELADELEWPPNATSPDELQRLGSTPPELLTDEQRRILDVHNHLFTDSSTGIKGSLRSDGQVELAGGRQALRISANWTTSQYGSTKSWRGSSSQLARRSRPPRTRLARRQGQSASRL